MDVTINSFESYKGSDILQWCKDNPNNYNAMNIMFEYFGETAKYKPNLNAYYFVDCGKTYMDLPSFKLTRDTIKSPRKSR